MNFRMFPFDHQLCPLRLESYSYSNDQVVFQWDENYPTPIEYSADIEVNDLEQGPKFVSPTCTMVGLKVYSEIYQNVQILEKFFDHRVQHQK